MKNMMKWLGALALLGMMLFAQSCVDDEEGFKLDDTLYLTPGKGDATFEYELVELQTTKGNILLWLYYQTPKHRENFLKLVKEEFYDSLIFHRVVKDFVVQGGDPLGTGAGGPGYEIDQEIKSFLPHVFGAVGAARTADQVNPLRKSSGSQFYIVENPSGTSFLNLNYTVFGMTVSGSTTITAIAGVATNSQDKPTTDVVINKAEVVKYTAAQLKTEFNFDVPFLE